MHNTHHVVHLSCITVTYNKKFVHNTIAIIYTSITVYIQVYNTLYTIVSIYGRDLGQTECSIYMSTCNNY